MNRSVSLCLLGFVVALGWLTPVGAETSELRVAKQYGLGYLQMILMETRSWSRNTRRQRAWGTSRSAGPPSDRATS